MDFCYVSKIRDVCVYFISSVKTAWAAWNWDNVWTTMQYNVIANAIWKVLSIFEKPYDGCKFICICVGREEESGGKYFNLFLKLTSTNTN